MQPKTIIDIYNEVLSGQRRTFPPGTWNTKRSKDDVAKVVRYLVLEKLKMQREDLLEHACLGFWCTYKISGAIRKVSKQDTRTFVINCFPEWDIKHWEFKIAKAPISYWTLETLTYATRWLIEERLNWELERVQNEISDSYFYKNGLGGMLQTLEMGAIDAVVHTYPDYNWTYLKERKGYRLTEAQVLEIRDHHKEGVSMHEIARWYNVNATSIFYVIHNRAYKEAPHDL